MAEPIVVLVLRKGGLSRLSADQNGALCVPGLVFRKSRSQESDFMVVVFFANELRFSKVQYVLFLV